jgi:hypothetical protein
MTTALDAKTLVAVPDGFDRCDVEQFLYREARYADESDYGAWEALWTDDALYWVSAGGADIDPVREMSVIYDNRSRIATRLKQVRTGDRCRRCADTHHDAARAAPSRKWFGVGDHVHRRRTGSRRRVPRDTVNDTQTGS